MFYTTQVWHKCLLLYLQLNYIIGYVKFKLDGIFVQELNSARVNSALKWVEPEVGHAVEGGLLVEDIFTCVHNNGAVHKVLNPAWPSILIKGQVPVCPACHIVIQVLNKEQVGEIKGTFYNNF